jgi:hypothetical protein
MLPVATRLSRIAAILCVLACGCVSLGTQQRERIAAYKADRSREFVSHFAESKADPRQADLVAIVTADAINAPLKHLQQRTFPAGNWEFIPTSAPTVEVNTGSALLRIQGDVEQKISGRRAAVTIVGGLAVRWNQDGSHLYLKPTALAVVPTLKIPLLDFALGAFIRNFAETQAQAYLDQRIGEIDVPVQLLLPIHRGQLTIDHKSAMPDDSGAVLRYQLPEATAQVQLQHLYVWPIEGRLIVLAYADVVHLAPHGAPVPPGGAHP